MTTTEATPTITEAPAAASTEPTTTAVAPPRTLSIVGFVLGIASLVTGQAFFMPAAAIVLGIIGYRREPAGRTFSILAIALGALALFGWMIVAALGLAFALPFFAFGDWTWML